MAVRITSLLFTLCATVGTSVHAASLRVCELAATRTGLAKFAATVETDRAGNGALAVDFDSDGSPDELKWSVTGSGSLIPADNSSLVLKLTASGKRFTLEKQRLHVIRLESHYYVVTGWVESGQGPWHKEVFSLTGKGITRICTFSGKGLGL